MLIGQRHIDKGQHLGSRQEIHYADPSSIMVQVRMLHELGVIDVPLRSGLLSDLERLFSLILHTRSQKKVLIFSFLRLGSFQLLLR